MPFKKRLTFVKEIAVTAESQNKHIRSKRDAIAANSFIPESLASNVTNPAILTIIFNNLSTRMNELNTDIAAELANFNENLQANTHHFDNLFIILQQIQQALSQKSSSII